MKTKNLVKKLVLNKKTIAHVDKDDMTKVLGGTSPTTLAHNSDVFLGATCCTCVATCNCTKTC